MCDVKIYQHLVSLTVGDVWIASNCIIEMISKVSE